MSVLESLFVESAKYRIPVIFKSDDFKEEVIRLLSEYITDLKRNNVSNDIVKRVEKFRRSCKFTLSNYLKGIHSNAFENFQKAIRALNLDNSPLFVSTLEKEVLFRGRVNAGDEDYTKDQMYHIPLDKRRIISSQRYSFPGLPCIYAGASVYTCWLELNRPSFEQFQVATIKQKNNTDDLKLYDLSKIPQCLKVLKEENEGFNDEDYLLYWPLLALCSIKVNHENAPFKPEYIFPQFLLEHILKEHKKVAGIKYMSIKAASICKQQLEDDWHTYVNYVFPSCSNEMSGTKCDTLNKLFEIHKCRSGRELQILARLLEIDNAKAKINNIENTHDNLKKLRDKLAGYHVYTANKEKYSYVLSVFGMIEMAMQRDRFDDIDEETTILLAISDSEIDETV